MSTIDEKGRRQKGLGLLLLGLGHFAAMTLVMFLVVRPLGDYLEFSITIPRWVLYSVMMSVLVLVGLTFAFTFYKIAKKNSLFPKHWMNKPSDSE